MPYLVTPRVLIAGEGRGVGKTFLGIGLALALRKRKLSVSTCVTGQALHQAQVYNRILGRFSRVLDRTLLGIDQVELAVYQAGLGADLILIDGTNGLYDGPVCGRVEGSDAEIATRVKAPIILVAEALEFQNSIAAVVKGYASLLPGIDVQGVILNRAPAMTDVDPSTVSPLRAYIDECLHLFRAPGCCGIIPPATIGESLPTGEFSQKVNQTALGMQFLTDITNLVEAYVDVDRIIEIARTAPEIELPDTILPPNNRQCRIAVSNDGCFSVTFQDNIDLLRYFGAEIVSFSPTVDAKLPRRVSGVYLTGAYLGGYAEELAENESMRDSLREFVSSGGMLYSEAAGTALLARTYQCEPGGAIYPGVGVLPCDVIPTQHPRSTVVAETSEGSILGENGQIIRGVSTGEFAPKGSELLSGRVVVPALRVLYAGGATVPEGYSATAQSFSTFFFFHFGSCPEIARSIVAAAATSFVTE